MRTNKITERLKQGPCTASDLPGRVSISYMGALDRQRIRKISIAGCSSKKMNMGQLRTVYYIEGDEALAIRLFAEVNADALAKLDFSRNTVIDSALPAGMAQRLRALLT